MILPGARPASSMIRMPFKGNVFGDIRYSKDNISRHGSDMIHIKRNFDKGRDCEKDI